MSVSCLTRDHMFPHSLRGLRLLAVPFLAMILAVAVSVPAPASAQSDRPETFADLAERLLPAVVNIQTAQTVESTRGPRVPNLPEGSPFEELFRDFFDRERPDNNGPRRRATSLGSGFFISADGFLVTNNHVIEGADEITVVLQDDTALEAELIGVDERTDIAVLKVEADQALPHVPWGVSDDMRVGDWVIAIGNPFGLGGTVTAGIISAFSRDINQGPYDDFIQTDASINRGNSGGPMFNMDGQVIGINTAIFSPTGGSVGIGFAIPADLAQNVVGQLIEFGRTRRGWLGVRIQTVTDEIADSLGLDQSMGALVAEVTSGGPAQAGGVERSDVIIEFDGQPVEQMRDLPRIVAETAVGKRVDVTVWRDGRRRNVGVVLGELEAAEQEGLLASAPADPDRGEPGRRVEALGMVLSDLGADERSEFDIADDAQGVVIVDVEPESEAAARGLVPGLVILEVGQELVSTPQDVTRQIASARDNGRSTVLLLVDRGGELTHVPMSIN